MDLLTPPPTDAQQELSARALRACMAAEAALASLRAECLPLQSSLPQLCVSGNRNLELAHRSLQLQIEACESLTLCATAAFKQLCDAHFLPLGRNGTATKLIQNGSTFSTQQPSCFPCPEKVAEESPKARNKEGTRKCNSTLQVQTQEEAPTIFGNSVSSQMTSDSEDALYASQDPLLLNPASISGSRSPVSSESSDHKTLKELAARLQSSDHSTPRDIVGSSDVKTSKESSQSNCATIFFTPKVSSHGVSPALEVREMNIDPFDGLELIGCSFSKNCAVSAVAASSNFPVNKVTAPLFRSSGSQAVPTRDLLSPSDSVPSGNDTTLNRDPFVGNDNILPSFSATTSSLASNQRAVTDLASPAHLQEAATKVGCNKVPPSTARPSCLVGHNIEPSFCCSSKLSPPNASQLYECLDGSSPATAYLGCVESTAASLDRINLTNDDPSLSSAGTGIVGHLVTLPGRSGSGERGASGKSTPPTRQQECNLNELFPHVRPNSCASPSYLNLGFLNNVDGLDMDKGQVWRPNETFGNLAKQGKQDSSSAAMDFAKPKGVRTCLNVQFSQAPSFDNPKAAYQCKQLGPPRVAVNAGYERPSWGKSNCQDATTCQMWPFSQAFEGRQQSASEQSRFATNNVPGEMFSPWTTVI